MASDGVFLFVVGLDTLLTRPTRRCLRKKKNFKQGAGLGHHEGRLRRRREHTALTVLAVELGRGLLTLSFAQCSRFDTAVELG